MKRFFKLISCVALMAFATTSYSQTAESTGVKKDKATETTHAITRRCGLNTEQQAKVQEMATNYFSQIDELKKDKATFADKKKVLDATYEIDLKKIFTAEQWAKFEEFRAEQEKR